MIADAWGADGLDQANARLIVEAANSLPKLLKVAEAARALDVELSSLWADKDRTAGEWRGNVLGAQSDLRKALEGLNDE